MDKLEGLAGVFSDMYFDVADSSYGISSMPLLRLAFWRYVRDNLTSNRKLAERLRWDSAFWTDADRAEFDAAMMKYWAEIQEKYPDRK